jgi:hypothetical protein
MRLKCATCQTKLPASQINVSTDVAVCPQCNSVFSVSDAVEAGQDSDVVDFDISQPPSGAWFKEDFDGWEVGSTTRSALAFFLVPFMCVWSGFSLGGIYGSQIIAGKFDLFASLFGLPFLAGTILFGSIAVMSVFGKEVVSVKNNVGRIFTGVGWIGWTRQFDWSEIKSIRDGVDYHRTKHGRSETPTIVLEGQTRLSCGSGLTEQRRYFMLQTLRKQFAQRDSKHR